MTALHSLQHTCIMHVAYDILGTLIIYMLTEAEQYSARQS